MEKRDRERTGAIHAIPADFAPASTFTVSEILSLLDSFPITMLLVDRQRRVHRMNSMALELLGTTARSVIGLRGGEAFRCVQAVASPRGCGFGHGCKSCVLRASILDVLESGRSVTGRETSYRVLKGDCEIELFFLISAAPINLSGVDLAFVCLEDITERRKAEQLLVQKEHQLQQAQKLEAVGRLAGGLAHDFNNLLSAIAGYNDLVTSTLRPTDPRRQDLAEIRTCVQRASDLTRKLLTFSRRQTTLKRRLDLNHVIRDLIQMLERLLGEDVILHVQSTPTACPVDADPTLIAQIVMNLAVNARDAMPGGGSLTISTSVVDLDRSGSASLGLAERGKHVVLSVSDSGSGMDEQTRSRIFEPFFTTKPEDRGTGLGLSMVHGIVQQLDGVISLESTPGLGTTFRIHLPLREPAEQAVDDQTYSSRLQEGTEAILLVEDDAQLRSLLARILEMHGYRVQEADNGRTVLERYTDTDRFDLVITDVIMPEMGGPEFVQRLYDSGHTPPVLFITGYMDDESCRQVRARTGARLLSKPFGPDALLREIRSILDG